MRLRLLITLAYNLFRRRYQCFCKGRSEGFVLAGLVIVISIGIISGLSSQLSTIPKVSTEAHTSTSRCFSALKTLFQNDTSASLSQLLKQSGCSQDGWSNDFLTFENPVSVVYPGSSRVLHPKYVIISAGADQKFQSYLQDQTLHISNADMHLILLTTQLSAAQQQIFSTEFEELRKALESAFRHGIHVETLEDLNLPLKYTLDRWGTSIKYESVTSDATQIQLHSAGPDRKFNTADDISWSIFRNSEISQRTDLSSSARLETASYQRTALDSQQQSVLERIKRQRISERRKYYHQSFFSTFQHKNDPDAPGYNEQAIATQLHRFVRRTTRQPMTISSRLLSKKSQITAQMKTELHLQQFRDIHRQQIPQPSEHLLQFFRQQRSN